jgi:hypothetical protein
VDITIYIEAPYPSQSGDRLFDADAFQDPAMAIPFIRMRDHFNDKGIRVHTADFLREKEYLSESNYYFSFGDVSNFENLTEENSGIDITLGSFVAFETPLIQPIIYRKMDAIIDSLGLFLHTIKVWSVAPINTNTFIFLLHIVKCKNLFGQIPAAVPSS